MTTVAATWGQLDGAGNQEIFDRFVDAEFQTDWAATVAQYGDKASTALMPRTDAQRRADALTAIFTRAASTAPGSRAPEPVVNILVDHHTWTDMMTLAGLFPEHRVDPFESRGQLVSEQRCETSNGDLVDPYTMLQASLEGYVRFVILDDAGVPIHWGRKRRLFRGAARDAVRTLGYRCFHPGCRVRGRRCQIDHTVEWHRAVRQIPTTAARMRPPQPTQTPTRVHRPPRPTTVTGTPTGPTALRFADQSCFLRTRSLIGVEPKPNASRMLRSR